MENKKGKYFFFVFLAVVSIMAILIFRPFFVVLCIAIALAVVLYPVYVWIRQHISRGVPWLASLITVLLFFIVLAVPLYFIGSKVVTETAALYTSLTEGGAAQTYIDNIVAWIHSVVPGSTELAVRDHLGGAITFLTNSIGKIFASTLHTVLSFLLILLSLFYFLKDGEHFRKYVIELSPLADGDDTTIFKKLSFAINGVMRGYILIAIIQGFLLGLGLYIFGVPNPVLWGVLAGIASMIPSVGTAIIALPAILYLYFTGDSFHALGLLIWSLALVGTIDNILNPVIVGKSINLPPIAVLFSVLGGIALFGVAGLIVGPLTLSLFLALMSIYKERYAAQ